MVSLAGAALAFAAGMAGLVQPGPSIRETIELTDLSSVAISPDDHWVAFREERALIGQNAYDLAWYVAPIDGSAPPRRVADAGEGDWRDGTLLSEPPLWTPDSRAILYRATIDGETQIWRASRDGARIGRLTHDPGNVLALALSSDGHRILFATGAPRAAIMRAERAEYDRGVRIDAHVDPSRGLFGSGRIAGRWAAVRLQGFWFGHGGLLGDGPRVNHVLDLATGTERAATHKEAQRLGGPVEPFTKIDGKLIDARAASGDARGAALVLADRGYGKLVVVHGESLAGAIACSADLCRNRHIRTVAWRPSRDDVVYSTTDGSGNDGLFVWHVDTGVVDRLRDGRGVLGGGRDGRNGCAIGQAVIVCVAASANVPPHLVAFDFATASERMLAAPDAAIAAEAHLHFTAIRWRGREGRTFTGQLMLPAVHAGPVPLFVTYYICSGYLRGGTGDEFPLRALAQAGIAALCINRYPTPEGIGNQVDDYRIGFAAVQSAIAYLSKSGTIDPRRVGMGGVSFGGEVAMWTAMHAHSLAAMAITNVMLTPTYYWFNAVAGRQVPAVLKQGWGVGDPDHDRAGWRRVSPVFNIASIRTPLLMQLPEQEYRPNVELLARLQRVGTPVELWAFPQETHILWQPRHRLAVNRRHLDWFRFWLQGWIDPDPALQDQYRHWRAFGRQPVTLSSHAGSPSQPRSQASVSMIGNRS